MLTTVTKKPLAESPFRKSSAEKALLKVAKKDYNKYRRYVDPTYTKKTGGAKALRTNDWSQMPQLLKMALAVDAVA